MRQQHRQFSPRPQLAAAVAALVWFQLLVTHGDAAAEAAAAGGGGGGHQLMGLPGCTTMCGDVRVPYPFGIEPGCYLKGFNLTCNTSHTPPQLVFLLGNDRYVVTNISLDRSTLSTFPSQLVCLKQSPAASQMPVPVPLPSAVPVPVTVSSGHQQPFKWPFPFNWWTTPCHFFSKHRVLDWEVGSRALLQGPLLLPTTLAGNATCPVDLGSTACHSSYSTCRSGGGSGLNITGYVCKCDDGYQGNPYLSDGCQDIDECGIRDNCFANCTNLPGKYLCECPEGTIGNPYIQDGCIKLHGPNKGLIIGLGVGSGVMLLIVVLVITLVIHKFKIQRKTRMRQRFFKQNRGQLLKQLVCQRADIAERMIVTLEEVEKATDNFNKARELGGGGHGIVYKGILSSLHVVAIKKSKIIIQREIDEFINEVAILSQINHRNIVKLFGCCLETEVPLLVYEFISNGTLYSHIHVGNLISLSWRDRLRIAVETARALAYLHSHASMPIMHRDVKSPNILLDDNLTVKLSDFGASRYIPIDQNGLNTTVQGTFGYLDPMYHSTGHLTEKSDVYSYGVLMIELLTRKKPVSYRSIEGHGLVYHFVTLLSEGSLVHILDPQVLKEGDGEVLDIALLAAICVKHISTERPTMRQVEMTLESIYAAKEFVSSEMASDEWSSEDMISVHANQVDFQTPEEFD